jgi:hypothetical protein
MNISTREKKMEIIDTTAPEGYEVAETTLAKNTVMALLDDLGNPACTEYPKLDETGDGLVVIPDIIGMADKILEKLIKIMAKKKEDTKKKGAKEKDPEKEAKRKARMEAIKNRPAGQRPNGKQIDVIKISDNSEVQNFGYAIKTKKGAQGVLVTSVLVVDGAPVNTSVAFVPGELAIKSKKGHGIITTPKSKKEKDTDEEVDEEETSEENED